jgi:hypothetical protein
VRDVVCAAALSAATWRLAGGNRIGALTLVLWIASIVYWLRALNGGDDTPARRHAGFDSRDGYVLVVESPETHR